MCYFKESGAAKNERISPWILFEFFSDYIEMHERRTGMKHQERRRLKRFTQSNYCLP